MLTKFSSAKNSMLVGLSKLVGRGSFHPPPFHCTLTYYSRLQKSCNNKLKQWKTTI